MRQVKGVKVTRLKVKSLKCLLVFLSTFYFLPSVRLHSQDVNQLVSEGNKLIKEKKYDEAVKVLLEAKKIDEKSPLPDVAFGMMFLRKNSLQEAEMHLKAAEKIAPELCGVQFTLALLYEKKDEKENAINYWSKLLRNPDFRDKDIAKKHLRFLGDEK